MTEKYHLLFTFMVGTEGEDYHIWLLVNGTAEEVEIHKQTKFSGEHDRLIEVIADTPYTSKERMYTLDTFNKLFMKDNKISKIPESITKMRKENRDHVLKFSRKHENTSRGYKVIDNNIKNPYKNELYNIIENTENNIKLNKNN